MGHTVIHQTRWRYCALLVLLFLSGFTNILLITKMCDQGSTLVYVKSTIKELFLADVMCAGDMPCSLYQREQRHIFMLPGDQTNGETVCNILQQFADKRNLSVLDSWLTPGVFSTTSKEYWTNTKPGTWEEKHDVLCSRLIFNEKFIRAVMPADTLYIGILRSPFERFISAFQHYTEHDPMPYLKNIPGGNPVSTYLANPSKWEPADPYHSRTNNRMSIEFGLEPKDWDQKGVEIYLDYLDKRFDLVMIGDMLDESLVMLKRLAGWKSLRDIVYLPYEHSANTKSYLFNQTERHDFRQTQYPDYALYHKFSERLFQQIAREADYGFHAEVAKFKEILASVKEFCLEVKTVKDVRNFAVDISKSEWNEEFYLNAQDCLRLESGDH